MSPDWRKVSTVPAGGSVLQVCAAEDGKEWLVSPSGLFCRNAGVWRLISQGLPFSQPGAITALGRVLLVSSLEGGIFRSSDGGSTWKLCRMDLIQSPITCFAASPNFKRDGVVIAGTAGDGILRSVDGGLSWQPVNFGLRDFHLLSLAASPQWSRREPMFAGTEQGLYLSPNGGRAWKFSGLEDQVVLSIAAQELNGQQMVFAGLESAGLYFSTDGGQQWQPVDLHLGGEVSVNCIHLDHERVLAGTSEFGLVCSFDGGNHFRSPDFGPEGVLSLSSGADRILAGTMEDGLWSSLDGGKTWSREEGLSARRFHRLTRLPAKSGKQAGSFLALSLNDGIWQSQKGERNWSRLENWTSQRRVIELRFEQDRFFAAAEDGVWVSLIGSAEWAQVLDVPEGITALYVDPDQVLAGSGDGHLWRSLDSGRLWKPIKTPFSSVWISGIIPSPEREDAFLVGCVGGRPLEGTVWQFAGDEHWDCVFSERTNWPILRLQSGGDDLKQLLICNGEACFRSDGHGWVKSNLSARMQPVSALTWDSVEKKWLLAGGSGLWSSIDGESWEMDADWQAGDPVADLEVTAETDSSRHLYALTPDGSLWAKS